MPSKVSLKRFAAPEGCTCSPVSCWKHTPGVARDVYVRPSRRSCRRAGCQHRPRRPLRTAPCSLLPRPEQMNSEAMRLFDDCRKGWCLRLGVEGPAALATPIANHQNTRRRAFDLLRQGWRSRPDFEIGDRRDEKNEAEHGGNVEEDFLNFKYV